MQSFNKIRTIRNSKFEKVEIWEQISVYENGMVSFLLLSSPYKQLPTSQVASQVEEKHELLSETVWKYPCLYDKQVKEYKNKNVVSRAWDSVAPDPSPRHVHVTSRPRPRPC